MKKTISVNISGLVFNIEEDAYSTLDHYLKEISARIKNGEDAKEIIRDVESRIAELFREKLSHTSEVITVEHVEEVKAILGKPADFSMEDGDEQTFESNATSEEKISSEKRMYRDTDNAKLGGVCSGIAAYFGVDALIIRILFVVLFIVGGSGVLLYLILLFIIPEAKTTAEKLRMRGEPVTVNNIKDHLNTIKEDLSKKAKNSSFVETFNDLIASLPPFVTKTLKIVSQVIGFIFLIGALIALFIVTSLFIGDASFLPFHINGHDLSMENGITLLYGDGVQYATLYLSILLFLYIPIIAFSYWGVKMLFAIQTKAKVSSVILSVLWTVSVVIGTYIGVTIALDMNKAEQVEEKINVSPWIDTLNIEFSNNLTDAPIEPDNQMSDFIVVKNKSYYIGNPRLELVANEVDDMFKVTVLKEAAANKSNEAINRAKLVSYNVLIWNDILKLSPYMKLPITEKYRNQNVTIIVAIPLGKEVQLGEKIEYTLNMSAELNESSKNSVFVNENNEIKMK